MPGREDPELGSRDLEIARRIVAGDEDAFVELVSQHRAPFLRLALSWARDPALAEEVVQETWVVALEKLAEFQGRSSLKTWLCGILINTARSRRRIELRSIPASALAELTDEPAVPPERFSPPGHRWDGHWQAPPSAWPETPEGAVLSAELRAALEESIAALPEVQRSVLLFREVEGLSGEEVCNALGLSSTHQRVLLHRARSRLRAQLESHYDGRIRVEESGS
ncbi:MAG TPA: sigma-70 family RNA polymerase sigma factor [Polyangia bacterium]|nr:sigma-70 family RNA polymerase sigma factor [Polyangia bacterium]